jgi:peroxiredoxin
MQEPPEFISNHSLAERLLSVKARRFCKIGLAKKANVWKRKLWSVPSTFLIDPDGKIKKIGKR